MTRHEGKGLMFEVPEGWEDRSVVAYAAPSSRANPNAPNVVVTQDKLGDGEDAAKYANRQIGELAKQLTGFRLQDQRDVVIGGLPAKELVFNWLGSRGRIVQRLAMVLQGARVTNVTTTVPTADVAKMAPVFEQILASMRFGAPAEMRAPRSASPPPIPVSSVRPSSSGSMPAVSSSPDSTAASPSSQSAISVAPPLLERAPRSRGGTHQIGMRAVADASGSARGAAAVLWQRPAQGLVARDLVQYMPWACRHEVVYVSDNEQHGVVVALGAGEPLVFADPARLTELNQFLRNENVTLPRGLPPNDFAQTVRTLLYGPEAYLGSPGFFERERHRYEVWVGQRGAAAEKLFRAHCEGAVLNGTAEGWALLFSCFSRRTGIERWEVTGEGSRIRTATFTAVDKPAG